VVSVVRANGEGQRFMKQEVQDVFGVAAAKQQEKCSMTKRGIARMFQCGCIVYVGLVVEAGAAPTPKVVACLNACAQVQLACAQPTLQMAADQRTIKDLNVIRACNAADLKCDRRCRVK
jgi:hypothetical protein